MKKFLPIIALALTSGSVFGQGWKTTFGNDADIQATDAFIFQDASATKHILWSEFLTDLGGEVQTLQNKTIDGFTLSDAMTVSGTNHHGIALVVLTTAQRDALVSLSAGDGPIWNSTTAQAEIYNGSAWEAIGSGGGGTSLTPNDLAGGTTLTIGNDEFDTFSANRVFDALAAGVDGDRIGLTFNATTPITLDFTNSTVYRILDSGVVTAPIAFGVGNHTLGLKKLDGKWWLTDAGDSGSAGAHASITVEGNVTDTVISGSSSDFSNKVQIAVFDTDGVENGLDGDHTNDHITVGSTGEYYVQANLSFSNGSADTISYALFINNGATQLGSRATRKLGTGGDVGSSTCSGIFSLTAGDTIEVWIQNEDATDNVLMEDGSLVVMGVGGGSGGGGGFDDSGDPIVQNTTTKDLQLGNNVAGLVGKVEIGADADQPQLVIDSHSSQTDDTLIILDGAGTETFTVGPLGTVSSELGVYDKIGPGGMEFGSTDVTQHVFQTDGGEVLELNDDSNSVSLSLSGDRIFHDTDADGVKDAGEEFIDHVAADQTGVHATPSVVNPLAPTWETATHMLWYGATGEIDLPAASGYTGRGIIIYNTGAFTITIDPNASEVIVRDGTVQTGGVSFTLSSGAGNFVSLISDGTRWITLGFKGTLAVGS